MARSPSSPPEPNRHRLLRDAREAAKITREQLASKLGCSYQAVASIENGRDRLSLEKVHEVATAIGCDPHSIDPRLASTR